MSKMSQLAQAVDDVKRNSLHRETENKRYRKCQVCNASFVTVERLMNPRIEKAIERAESEEGK